MWPGVGGARDEIEMRVREMGSSVLGKKVAAIEASLGTFSGELSGCVVEKPIRKN